MQMKGHRIKIMRLEIDDTHNTELYNVALIQA
jgi:hypothetical protein